MNEISTLVLKIGSFSNSVEMKKVLFPNSQSKYEYDLEKGGNVSNDNNDVEFNTHSSSDTIENDVAFSIVSEDSQDSNSDTDSDQEEEDDPDKLILAEEGLSKKLSKKVNKGIGIHNDHPIHSSPTSPNRKRKKKEPLGQLDENNNFTQGYQNSMVATRIRKVLGSSILDLRNSHDLTQRRRSYQKKNYDSDSDSDSSLEDSIRRLSQTDTTWFNGCGFKITLDTSIFFSQLIIAILGLVFCIIKLSTSDSCDVTQIYAPIFTAILGYFFASPLKNFQTETKKKLKKK